MSVKTWVSHHRDVTAVFGGGVLIYLTLCYLATGPAQHREALPWLFILAPVSILGMAAEYISPWIVVPIICLLQGFTYVIVYQILRWMIRTVRKA